VQKLLRDNGNQFLVAVGSGDLAAIEAIAQRRQTSGPALVAATASAQGDDEMLDGASRVKPSRRFGARRDPRARRKARRPRPLLEAASGRGGFAGHGLIRAMKVHATYAIEEPERRLS
jgi:hypothetical protein